MTCHSVLLGVYLKTTLSEKEPNEDLAQFRRRQIIEAAQVVFARKGYHQTGISDIAVELGIGHGTFYRYFKNKRDIFVNLIEVIIQRVASVVMSQNPNAANTLTEYQDQVLQIGDRLMTLFIDDESLSRLLQYESWGLDQDLRGRIHEMMDVFARFTENYLINGRDKGFLRQDLDTKKTAVAINAFIFEAARRISTAENKASEKDLWLKAITQLMFDGIRS